VTPPVAAFDKSYDLAAFRSGNIELVAWLHDHAESSAGQGTRTYVVVNNGDVAGYFAVTPHVLDRAEVPTKLARGSPRIPSILLAKLALSQHLHGRVSVLNFWCERLARSSKPPGSPAANWSLSTRSTVRRQRSTGATTFNRSRIDPTGSS
jgi:hypothetical protein